ncbi:MAG: NYN domain-containing protein [Clostridia bacterium]|nr:NYN domain-containing protein [Clostridia bacterium]
MTYYLVDTENVQTNWDVLVPTADERDEFILFYSKATSKMSMSLFGQAGLKDIRFKFLECYTGRNGMDFQIATELGHLVNQHRTDGFTIVSDDTGFDVLVSYWKDRNVRVTRQGVKKDKPDEPVHETKPPVQSQPQTKQDPIRQSYRDKLKKHGLSEKETTEIVEILYAAMQLPQNARKLEAFNQFQKKYGSKKGQEKYNELKTLIKTISTSGPFPPVRTNDNKKEKLITQIVNLCPDLKPKEQKKMNNILKSARANKKEKKKQAQYRTQLESSFGKDKAAVLFERTKHLL